VRFEAAAPLADIAEMARRMLTPLADAKAEAAAAGAGRRLGGQPVDVSAERFVLYVPAHRPASGYGLLVFVPPWNDARIPDGWIPILDRFGVIFVSAAGSGNEAMLGRRAPLALLAAENARLLYTVDPERTYVGGLSGGSRVAMRLALGYPDLFRGALLNAGSDPIGQEQAPLPPESLFERFQADSRIAMVTGERDDGNLRKDAESQISMRELCVFNIDVETVPRLGHEIAPAAALARAFDYLDRPPRARAERLASCRAKVAATLSDRIGRIHALAASGQRAAGQGPTGVGRP
jgi:pimeloyl-ACP methyl ester carboxylesterase